MKYSNTKHDSLIDVIVPIKGFAADVTLIAGFAVLTAFCAQLSFWIGPVPVTGQTFAVLVSGAILGSKRGALSQLSYLTVGITGMPFWFAAGGVPGIARLLGPTGGYLIGFVAAAYIVGWLSERGWDKNFGTASLAMLFGCACYYIIALPWLASFIGVGQVLQAGLYPFIFGDLIKLTLAAITLPTAWHFLHINGR